MSPELAETAKIITVADGFCVRQAVDNMAWIDMGDYAIVVDALERQELEAGVFDAIASTFDPKRISYVLNTHTHPDHTALNPAFGRRCGAEIVNLHTHHIPRDGRWFEGTQRRAVMLPMGGVHSGHDCIVWVPSDKALFTGDLFGWGLIPLAGPLRDDAAKRVLDAYALMIEFDPHVVIPGHGPLCSSGELRRWVEYFNHLCHQVRDAVLSGKTDAQIIEQIAPPEDMAHWWRFVQWKHEDSLNKVLEAVRCGALSI